MTTTKALDDLIALEAIKEKVRGGALDLRDVGLALQTGFDQDFPARVISFAIAHLKTTEAGYVMPGYGALTIHQQNAFGEWVCSLLKKGSIDDWADIPDEFGKLRAMLTAAPSPAKDDEWKHANFNAKEADAVAEFFSDPAKDDVERGWAVFDDGKMLVATVSQTRRAAIINWLVTERAMIIFNENTDEEIEAAWLSMKITAECCEVNIARAAIAAMEKP